MYKIVLPCFIIISCYIFLAIGESNSTPAPTECEKSANCTECTTNACIFCYSDDLKSETCVDNSTLCEEPHKAVKNKTQCSEVPTPSPTIATPTTTASTTASKTEPTVTTAISSSSDASESTTLPPKPSSTPSGRHFDAPSFIGGTVLSLGLLAIIYVGFKFYKARTERNYHTL